MNCLSKCIKLYFFFRKINFKKCVPTLPKISDPKPEKHFFLFGLSYIFNYVNSITLNPLPPPPFNWTTIQLRLWRSSIFSKIIPNRRGSVHCHTIWGLDASSTLPLRFYYASVTLLLRSLYDNEDLATLSLG